MCTPPDLIVNADPTPLPHTALRGATWNVERGRRPAAVRRALANRVLVHRLDFVLLQELSGYVGYLTRHPIKGYTLVAPDRANAVLVRDGITAEHARNDDMSDAGWFTHTGRPHPGASGTVVLLGGWLRTVSVHGPVSVSWPKGTPRGPSRRVAAYLDHTDWLVDYVAKGRARHPHLSHLLGGDWNARTWEHGPGTPADLAKRAHLQLVEPAKREGPGHNGIDYVATDTRVDGMRKRGTGGSDHPFVTFVVYPPTAVA